MKLMIDITSHLQCNSQCLNEKEKILPFRLRCDQLTDGELFTSYLYSISCPCMSTRCRPTSCITSVFENGTYMI